MRLSNVIALLTATLAAAFLFNGNLHTDDTGIVAGLLFILAGLVGFISQRFGRVTGMLLGLSIVASELWNYFARSPRAGMSSPGDFILLAVAVTAIATIGSVIGHASRRTLQKKQREPVKEREPLKKVESVSLRAISG